MVCQKNYDFKPTSVLDKHELALAIGIEFWHYVQGK